MYVDADPDKDIRKLALYQWVQKAPNISARLDLIQKYFADPDLQETAINSDSNLKAMAKPFLPAIRAAIEKADDKLKIEFLADDLDIDPADVRAYGALISYVKNSNVDLAKQAVDALVNDDGLRAKSKSDLQRIHDDTETIRDVKLEIETTEASHK